MTSSSRAEENAGWRPLVRDRYRLEGMIGRGGAGAVWRAHDQRLDRAIAVKEIIWPADPSERDKERALREARAAARLSDPGVVQVFDMVTEEDRAYLVMELVDAPSLQRLVDEHGPLPPDRVAALGARMLATLVAAHDAGIIHRDVKPSNVLVDVGVPRLTDFGIARLAGDTALTMTGTVLGTPSYIAPEQARGEAAGPAADLYGLGATLYFAVEGAAPFSGETPVATAAAVLNAPHRPLERAADLTYLIEALLRKDPEARPDAAEVRRRLQVVHSGKRVASADAAALMGDGAAVEQDRRGEPGRSTQPEPAAPAAAFTAPTSHENVGGKAGPAQPGTRRLLAVLGTLLGAALVAVSGFTLIDGLRSALDTAPDATATEHGNAGGSPAPQEEPDSAVLPPSAEVPDDWVTFMAEDAPYEVQHPPGWEVIVQSATITDLRDPETGIFLRLDWVDEGRDPVEAWEALSADLAERRSGYEELRLEPTVFRDNQAALWEYRYRDGGHGRRAYNLGVTTGQQGYAINLNAPSSQWDDAKDLWPAFLSSYEFAGD